jgi:hypothetical protein
MAFEKFIPLVHFKVNSASNKSEYQESSLGGGG